MGAGPAAGSGQRSMAAPGSDAPSKETRGQAPPPADVTRPCLPPSRPARRVPPRDGERGSGHGTPRAAETPCPSGDIPTVTSPRGHPRECLTAHLGAAPDTQRGAGTTPAVIARGERSSIADFCPGGAAESHNESQVWLGQSPFILESLCTWRQPGRAAGTCQDLAGLHLPCWVSRAVPQPRSKVWLLSWVARNPPGKGIFPLAHGSFFQLAMPY